MIRTALLLALLALLSACTPPGAVRRADDFRTAKSRELSNFDPAQLPPPQLRVYAGDSLRIVRDAQSPAQADQMNLFVVRPDGSFAYPFIGKVQAAGRTPEQVGAEIARRQAAIYREPEVTVNIAIAPGNRVYVGGAVRNPGAFDLASAATVEQALTGSGGVLPIGDSRHVALVRLDGDGRRQVYFFDYGALLQSSTDGSRAVALQRGDVLFVPTSRVGNAVQGMDLYVTQLLPFFRGIGIGANYQINQPSTEVKLNGGANNP